MNCCEHTGQCSDMILNKKERLIELTPLENKPCKTEETTHKNNIFEPGEENIMN